MPVLKICCVVCAIVSVSALYETRIAPTIRFVNSNQHLRKILCTAIIASINFQIPHAFADDAAIESQHSASNSYSSRINQVKNVPLLTKRSSDLQQYVDLGRGFKLLRPFGYNEFQGSDGSYAVKFASLFEVDENVVVGNVPAPAEKKSIADFGTLESVGEKLMKKRYSYSSYATFHPPGSSQYALTAVGICRYMYKYCNLCVLVTSGERVLGW